MRIWSRAELIGSGLTPSRIRDAVREGRLRRLRRDCYVSGDIDPAAATALAHGCAVSCGSALALHGVWVIDHGLHVRVRRTGGVVAAHGVARTHVTGDHEPGGVDGVAAALAVAIGCLPFEEAVCAVDSVLNRGLMSEDDVLQILSRSGVGRRIVRHVDGRAESGLETLVRLRLRRLGIRCEPQVRVPGVGRVDLVVGDRLVIETDGDRWHSSAAQREEDRRRDAVLVCDDRLVLRLGYRRIVHEWPAAEAQILSLVRRRRHRTANGSKDQTRRDGRG